MVETIIVCLMVGFFALQTLCLSYLLAMSIYYVTLILKYRSTRGPDPEPARLYSYDELPSITVQLPVFNEGILAERCLQGACALEYPDDRLQIQFIDDSDDTTTTEIAQKTIGKLRLQRPGLDIQYLSRGNRADFKAGALSYGSTQATGEFMAIFDADFLIPPDFLLQTVHFFTDEKIGVVQARWDYYNRNASILTKLQAERLDTHQMFEQTARYNSGRIAIFHGTAGIWRARTLQEVGGWSCISEVEDAELTIKAALAGWKIIYLNHLRVFSELPESILSYLRQQMRWKRGWTRLTWHYTRSILNDARTPLYARLDLLQRIHTCWGPASALLMTLGALPYFLVAAHFNLSLFAIALYLSSLLVSLVTRHLEQKTLQEDPMYKPEKRRHPLLRWVPLNYMMALGTGWAMAQSTIEGLRHECVWEVTSKGTGLSGTPSQVPAGLQRRLPLFAFGIMAMGVLSLILIWASFATAHPIAALFYVMLTFGCGWVSWLMISENKQALL